MPKKQTWKILRWDGGRNDKWDPRDIADNEIAQGNNVDISQPGFIQTGGSFTAASSSPHIIVSPVALWTLKSFVLIIKLPAPVSLNNKLPVAQSI